MLNSTRTENFFSISLNFVPIGTPIPYDLYINSSTVEDRRHFVRMVLRSDVLTDGDLQSLQKRYRQLYIPEIQRSAYLQTICNHSGSSVFEKTIVLKGSAIHYLENLFDKNKEFSTEMLAESINGSRDVIANMVDVLQNYNVDHLQELIANLSFHDFYTYDHSINVSMYCILLFKFVKPEATRDEVIHAGLGGLLHDLGKIKIPTHILNKPDQLTHEEFFLIKQHPQYGRDCLLQSELNLVNELNVELLSRVIYEHHENIDGTGYPLQLKGEDIHLLARVTAIADFFDALTTRRSYHKTLSTEDALALMSRSVGKKIDPQIFEFFTRLTARYENDRRSKSELPSDFDPCQPHARLPLKMITALAPSGYQDYGKIKVIGNKGEVQNLSHSKNLQITEETQPKQMEKKKLK